MATVVGGTLYKIKPEKNYTSADLDWQDKSSRSSLEYANPKIRPAIISDLKNLASYDTVYLGYPIWWNEVPKIINTFIESYKFEGKSVIPFATSGGSGINNFEKELQKTYPKVKWDKGKLLNRLTEKDIKDWLKQ